MENFGGDRIEESFGKFRLLVIEEQADVFLFDAVTMLGGRIEEERGKNGEYVFNFTRVNFTRSGFSKIIDSAIPRAEIASN